jgi:NTP pyrophosphatase (non-canonical NTP hydrolase)
MAADYTFGSDNWPGLSKLVEECGEVIQVCGKIMGTGGQFEHWDGSNLAERLEDELGDLTAAIDFVTFHVGLLRSRIAQRAEEKFDTFERWHAEGDPPPDKPSRFLVVVNPTKRE